MEDPYTAPATSPESSADRQKTGLTGITILLIVFAWILWSVVLLSNLGDLMIVHLSDKPAGDATTTNMLLPMAFGAACLLLASFFLRWLIFGFLINPKRVRPGGGAAAGLGVLGVLLIYFCAKSVETCGLILMLQRRSWPEYLPFAIVSFIALLILMPNRLLKKAH